MARTWVWGAAATLLLGGLLGCGAGQAGGEGTQPLPPGARPLEPVPLVAQDEDGGGGGDDDEGGPPGEPCQPTAGGPHWLQEGESLTLKVTCATGRQLKPQQLRILEPLPPGASYDKKTATLHWTPGLDQAAVYELTLRAPRGETGAVKVGVADHFGHPDNVPVVDLARYTEEYGLPVFHLQGASGLNPQAHQPLTVLYRGHTYAAQGRVRGSSSLAFPKNNYTLKFSEADPFHEPHLGEGFTGRRSLVLVNTFNDNSYLRARLGFEVWGRLSPGALQVKTYSAVVFLDGAYHGLYTVADHVNEHLAAAHGLNKAGNLYKSETGVANFRLVDPRGRPKARLSLGFETKEGRPRRGEPGAFEDLEAFVHFVATASDEAFRKEGPQRLELRDYEDWWALVTLLVAQDSDVKNAYHYHDPQGGPHGGPWRYVPWDLDGVFGQTWKTQRLRPTAPLDMGEDNEVFRRLLSEPGFSGPLRARLKAALSAELSAGLLQARVDELARELGPSARRDEARWGEQYRTFPLWSFRQDYTTFDEEVAYVRQWIALRWAFLEQQLASP